MELINYLNKKVYITLNNGFYYTGLVFDADENSISLKDKNGRMVTLTKFAISTITEVQQ